MAMAGGHSTSAPAVPAATDPARGPFARPAFLALPILAAIGATLFAIRLTGLPNLLDNEYRVGACVLDVLQHGNWLCPHDVLGNTDKPPMLTWLAALASWPSGRVTPFTLYLPTAVATLLIAWLIADAGGRRFGERAGLFGGLAYLLSEVGAQQMATARWDGVFALTVTVAALLAFRAWMTGGGWTWFWLAAAASTLTKGPLGLLLAVLGLAAIVWERRTDHPTRLEGSHANGVVLFLLLTVGWFLLAYRQVGPHLVTNMIGDEFAGNIVEHRIAYRFWKPPGDFLANFAPWSVLTLVGLYRVITAPSSGDEARRFERFLFCWFTGGLLLFCLSPHNQARLMDPMIPPAAILAGREIDRLVRPLARRALIALTTVGAIAALGVFAVQYHRLERHRPAVRETLALQGLARTVRTAVGDDFPLTYVEDAPFAIQLALNTMRPPVSFDEAARLLRGDTAAFVVVGSVKRLRTALGADSPPPHELARALDAGKPYLHLVSNRPALTARDPTATRVGPLVVTLTGAHLRAAWDNRLALARGDGAGSALIENVSDRRQDVTVRIDRAASSAHVLGPGEAWRIEVP
jgi:4-amino-4-deoxy-L-arabinose transferase-like glycosyltransferase